MVFTLWVLDFIGVGGWVDRGGRIKKRELISLLFIVGKLEYYFNKIGA